ncbi:MAG: integration host factor subunit beta [Candidatus Competibacteraceae bacterium]|nr:integration host factor subunit beta [Candidatus Competibacteraceae bacterium]
MTKSELIEILAHKRNDIPYRDVEQAVKTLLEQMSESLSSGERIEIRGFGSFSLHFRPPRVGRNPKTGDAVSLTSKYVPHFKPGKELRERVNSYYENGHETL